MADKNAVVRVRSFSIYLFFFLLTCRGNCPLVLDRVVLASFWTLLDR